jgi:hypothetical protein
VAAEQVHHGCQDAQFFCQPNNRYNRAKHAIKDVHQVAMEKRKWNKTWVAMVMMDG